MPRVCVWGVMGLERTASGLGNGDGPRSSVPKILLAALAVWSGAMLPGLAQEITAIPIIDVIAERPGEGPTQAASEKNLTGDDLAKRQYTRPAEALEATPGLIVTQHSGEGKANQYFLRCRWAPPRSNAVQLKYCVAFSVLPRLLSGDVR